MNPAVVVFVKPRCVQCTAVKKFLGDAGVRFETQDLAAPENAPQLEWFKSKGFLSAPITVYGEGHAVAGFDPSALGALAEAYLADKSR